MHAGDNDVYVSKCISTGSWLNLDYIDVSDATTPGSVEPPQEEVVKPANPFVTSIYTADPSARVWEDGRLYVYPSHDMYPARGCDLMDRYHVYSTDNMVDWRDEGEILGSDDVEWGRSEGGFMWAPDCVYKDGTYYFFYPHPSGNGSDPETGWNATWKMGVATSKFPTKGFEDQGYVTYKDADGNTQPYAGYALIDPNVFIDDDGRAYLYIGGGGKAFVGELNDDMMTLKGEPQQIEGLTDFHEGTWVFKRNGIYYLTYPDNQGPDNCMRYATSYSPLGPWTNRGIYLEGTGSGTSHGSIAEYKGKWYAFYHNAAIGAGNLRSICVDELFFNEDGTIQMVKQTQTGVEAVGPRVEPSPDMTTYEAEDAVLDGGAVLGSDLEASGDKVVKDLYKAGSSVTFQNVDGGEKGGRATISIHYAAPEKAKFQLSVNGEDHSYINLYETGGASFFSGVETYTVWMTPGKTNTIRFEGGNSRVFLDYITVTPFNDLDEAAPAPSQKTTAKISKAWDRLTINSPMDDLTVTVTSPTLTNKQVTFSVSDEDALQVVNVGYDEETGVNSATVIASKEGVYTVFATTADGVRVSCTLDCYILPSTVTLNETNYENYADTTFTLSATVTQGTLQSDRQVTFTTSDKSGIEFRDLQFDEKTGVTTVTVVLKKEGSYTVYATTADGQTASCSVFVWENPDIELGDINEDGKVDTTDARLALQHAVGKIQLTESQIFAGDVNADNKVDTTDARLILQKAVGKIDKFPAE